MNDRIGDFVQTGGGPMADFFENIAPKIGVTADMFRDLSGADALQLYVDTLQKANLNQQDFTYYMEAMASDSTLLIPLLRDGGAAMAEYADRAERMGAIMSNEMIASLREGKDALAEMRMAVDGMKNTIGAQAVPAIKAMSAAVAGAAMFFHQHADTITDVLRTMAGTAAVVAAAFATRYAVAVGVTTVKALVSAWRSSVALNMALGAQSLAAARAGVAVKTLSAGLTVLRRAIVSTGIGALIVGAGYLVGKFGELVRAAGGFGEALSLLKDVATEAWQGIASSADIIPTSLGVAWDKIRQGFYNMLAGMTSAFADFIKDINLLSVNVGRNSVAHRLFGMEPGDHSILGGGDLFSGTVASLEASAESMRGRATSAGSDAAAGIAALANDPGIKQASAALQRLRDIVRGTADGASQIPPAASAAGAALEDLGEAGGSAGRKAADGLKKTKDELDEVKRTAERGADAIGGAFSGLLDRTKSLREGIADLIMEIARMQMMEGFRSLFGAGGSFGGLGLSIGNLIGANANGTNNWRGGLTRIHERGGEIVDLPARTRIIPHDVSKRMVDGQGTGAVNINVNIEGANGDQHVIQLVQQGVSAGLRSYDQGLPDRMSEINSKSRWR